MICGCFYFLFHWTCLLFCLLSANVTKINPILNLVATTSIMLLTFSKKLLRKTVLHYPDAIKHIKYKPPLFDLFSHQPIQGNTEIPFSSISLLCTGPIYILSWSSLAVLWLSQCDGSGRVGVPVVLQLEGIDSTQGFAYCYLASKANCNSKSRGKMTGIGQRCQKAEAADHRRTLLERHSFIADVQALSF